MGGAIVNIATYHINIHWNMGNLRTSRRSELTWVSGDPNDHDLVLKYRHMGVQ